MDYLHLAFPVSLVFLFGVNVYLTETGKLKPNRFFSYIPVIAIMALLCVITIAEAIYTANIYRVVFTITAGAYFLYMIIRSRQEMKREKEKTM